jgi:Lsr2
LPINPPATGFFGATEWNGPFQNSCSFSGCAEALPVLKPLLAFSLYPVYMQNSDGVDRQDEWTPAEVRAWARERGLGVGERGRIPEAVIELYLAQPSRVRRWASDRGITVSERGRLPTEVLEQYLARPEAVRAWARRQGIEVGERGRLPVALVERFLDRFRQLEWDAA